MDHGENCIMMSFITCILRQRVIKSMKMRWAGHVAHMGGEVLTGFWLGGPKARDHWGDLGKGGRITLKWT
jgi:hypothetical protein